ncbi:MAG: peptidylprolyl isomerase [Saprospiraceae bacterium]|uniref:peptidylprolyl isomerase n=1 Tax=Candidatus Defluviibacterium haderslevense TaxID=2981993 RepID=A0A9D7XDQ3_9BACT|nr:peptidylprolyl isomerase [Candidatus Defluviibacterium haderslevense]
MKKLIYLVLTLMFATLLANGQDSAKTFQEIKEKLKETEGSLEIYTWLNKQPNISFKSGMMPESDTANNLYKLAFSAKAGDIVGPLQNKDGTCSIIRVTSKGENYLMKVSYIYLDKKSESDSILENKADSILYILKSGVDFATLAKKYSMDGNAKNGGDLGWFEAGVMNQQFENAIRKHKKGDYFKVKVDQYGWYVILVTSDQGHKKYIGRLEITKLNCS